MRELQSKKPKVKPERRKEAATSHDRIVDDLFVVKLSKLLSLEKKGEGVAEVSHLIFL